MVQDVVVTKDIVGRMQMLVSQMQVTGGVTLKRQEL
jgi:hypothetical protein